MRRVSLYTPTLLYASIQAHTAFVGWHRDELLGMNCFLGDSIPPHSVCLYIQSSIEVYPAPRRFTLIAAVQDSDA